MLFGEAEDSRQKVNSIINKVKQDSEKEGLERDTESLYFEIRINQDQTIPKWVKKKALEIYTNQVTP
jgi:two-component SAPR family response regulator